MVYERDYIFACEQGPGRRHNEKLADLQPGEIPVKLTVNVEPGAFREPVIEKEVTINDWQEDIPASDVNFEKTFITPQEADMLRQKRLSDMAAIMKKHGYTVTRNDE